MFRIESSGSFAKTEALLKQKPDTRVRRILEKYGRQGVSALSAATPKDTGLVASSWDYEIVSKRNGGLALAWTNGVTNTGFSVAAMLQYGYATGTGGYVTGRDYINPVLRPIFEQISAEIRREVNNA